MGNLMKGHDGCGNSFWLIGCVGALPGFYCWLPAPMAPKAKAAMKVVAVGKPMKVLPMKAKEMKVMPMKAIEKSKDGKQQTKHPKLSKVALESTDLEPLTLD